MRLLLLLIALTLFYPQISQAQRFEAGLLVLSSGDTLRGEVENAFWLEPPAQVRFRPAPGAAILTYEAGTIQAFRLTAGRCFKRALLPFDATAETQLDRLPHERTSHQQPTSLLAEVLVEGNASLLRVVTLMEVTHYFVRGENRDYLELTQRLYLREYQDRQVVADGNDYQAQLRIYFIDCGVVGQAALTTPYTATGLTALIQLYNQQCGTNHQAGTDFTRLTNSKRHATAYNAGVYGGSHFNSLRLRNRNFSGLGYPTLNGVNIDNHAHPLAGLYIDLLTPGRRGAVHGDLAISSVGQSGLLTTPAGSVAPRCHYSWQANIASARLAGRRLIPVGRQHTQLFIGLGVVLGYVWNTQTLLEYGTATAFVPTSRVRFIEPETFNSLPYLELGLRKNRLTVALDANPYSKIEYYDGMTGYQYSGQPWSFSATVGFRLNANTDENVK